MKLVRPLHRRIEHGFVQVLALVVVRLGAQQAAATPLFYSGHANVEGCGSFLQSQESGGAQTGEAVLERAGLAQVTDVQTAKGLTT